MDSSNANPVGCANELAELLEHLVRYIASRDQEVQMGNQRDERVNGHYGWSGLMEAIADEIRGKGIDPERVTVAQLAPVDNYQWHRLAGTLALAHVAKITAADRVLDVGGGIGGPARQLAHRLGCHVTVLDITTEYCAVGETLTR